MILVNVSRTADKLHQLLLKTWARAKGLTIRLVRREVEGAGAEGDDLVGARIVFFSCVASGMFLLKMQSLS